MTTLPGQGALRDGTRQRGHSALAAPRALVPRTAAPVPARGARLLSWGATAVNVVFLTLMLVNAASAETTRQDRVPEQGAALQGGKQGASDNMCLPGFFLSEHTGDCEPCTRGMEFTNHSNTLPSCLFCSRCGEGEEEASPCTPTKDRECRCKPGTFLGENSPEFCRRCSTRCPEGMVVTRNCTPWSDLKCVAQESSNETIGEAHLPREPVTLRPGLHTTPSPSSGSLQPGIYIAIAVCVCLLVAIICVCLYRNKGQGSSVNLNWMNRVFFRRLCPPRGPGALDNACNEIVSQRVSLSSQASEQQMEDQAYSEMEEVVIESPEEVEHLLASGCSSITSQTSFPSVLGASHETDGPQ